MTVNKAEEWDKNVSVAETGEDMMEHSTSDVFSISVALPLTHHSLNDQFNQV